MADFRTKIDLGDNRQGLQRVHTITDLSGTTIFGTDYSGLTAGVDLNTIGTTSTLVNVDTTFSGDSFQTIFTFPDARMVVASESLNVITNLNSGDTQNAVGFEVTESTVIDGNTVNLLYSGASFDFTVTEIFEDNFVGWSGTANSDVVQFLSASTLDYQERLIWVDVKGITKTKQLVIEDLPIKNNTLQAVLGRQADGDVVEVDLAEINSLFRATYAEYQTIIANNELIVGNKYILTDYKTIYQIEGTTTSPIIARYVLNGNSGNYAYFADGIPTSSISANGDTATITALPSGYGGGLSIGQTVTVVDYFNSNYILFSPTVNVTGIEIFINKPRWSQVATDEVILDLSGNTVMQPGGVLNVDVHNDLPYMNMSGAENESPKVEELILTAIAENQFSIEAESLTYKGDLVLYYFDDNVILDENDVQIGTRNGLIKKRDAFDLNISINKDWRVQRYRRWVMDDDNWTGYTLKNDLYKVGGVNVCTTVNNTITIEHKYILPFIDNPDFYLDFASDANTDPFLTGTTVAPSAAASERLSNDTAPEFMHDVSIPYSGVTEAKDLLIFPITNNVIDPLVTYFKCEELVNSIFRLGSNRYGSSGEYKIIGEGRFYYSSFMSGAFLKSEGANFTRVTSIDAVNITLGGISLFSDINLFSFGSISSNGTLYNVSIGGYRSNKNDYFSYTIDDSSIIRNSVLGYERADDMRFSNFVTSRFLLKFRETGNNVITGSSYLTTLQSSLDIWGASININNWYHWNPNGKASFGYVYTIIANIFERNINNLGSNKQFIYEYKDNINITSLVTVSTLQ
jgi:hypothetical protein